MLLSTALQMQQDLEDKKNEIIIEGLENKIKEYEASLEKKDFLLQAMEGSLEKAQTKNARLNRELLQKSESFEQERKNLQTKYEAEAVENTKLQHSLKELRNMCLGFVSRCVQRLKKVSTQLEPILKSLPLRPKTYQAPLNTLKAKSRRLTK
jgi:chromosome segregation ATPase